MRLRHKPTRPLTYSLSAPALAAMANLSDRPSSGKRHENGLT